ncbi:hypothetical protein K470DRAFT_6208 [Piedraia hortae CBS 480.64]|uniref:Uncharacterized protein n=1 Tax=Piedraia hortae CBS 480.64 TaxID=1314780 RepID=A0A6A7CCK1_9PEZI|nr:hypothetical protein K470DRAFT_6208 [Piedraia hortae CBS 480.64]
MMERAVKSGGERCDWWWAVCRLSPAVSYRTRTQWRRTSWRARRIAPAPPQRGVIYPSGLCSTLQLEHLSYTGGSSHVTRNQSVARCHRRHQPPPESLSTLNCIKALIAQIQD